MRHKIKLHYMACLLSAAMLLTMGMSFGTGNRDYTDAPPKTSMEANIKVHTSEFFLQPPINNPDVVLSNSSDGDSQVSIQTTLKERNDELANLVPAAVQYEVSAYCLNVRTKADSESKILRVVNKGTVIDVLQTTGNGWLQLSDGGFVNGKYAQRLPETFPKTAVVFERALQSVDHAYPIGTPRRPGSNVKSDSGLMEAGIEEIFRGTALANQELEKAILEIEAEFGINAYFTIAVLKLESAHGQSRIARDKNNLFGLNAIDGAAYKNAYSFNTKQESVRKFGEIIADHYFGEGYTTVEAVATKYCQANSDWPVLVKSIMEGDFRKIKSTLIAEIT